MSSPLQDSQDSPRQSLNSVSQLLHLTHHRNKNQHRLAKWYKAFSVLRRQVGKLVDEVERLERVLKFSSTPSVVVSGQEGRGEKEGKRKKGKGGDGKGKREEGKEEGREESKYVRAAREKVEERVDFMEVWVVPKCFLAFSNLVADNQYASLGLMLMATLARVQTLLKILGKSSEDSNQNENGDVDGDQVVTLGKEILGAELGLMEGARENDTDLGEVVSREEILDVEKEKDTGDVESRKTKKKKKRKEEEIASGGDGDGATPAMKPKKKRKKGDAFDDLFAGLI